MVAKFLLAQFYLLQINKNYWMSGYLQTPERKKEKREPQTQLRSEQRLKGPQTHFKQKAFELMQNLVQMQIQQTNYQNQIQSLQKELHLTNKKIHSFLSKVGIKSLDQASLIFQNIVSQPKNQNCHRLTKIQNKLQYILQKQSEEQVKFLKESEKEKGMKRMEEESREWEEKMREVEDENLRIKEEYKYMERENRQLKNEKQIIKKEYKKRMEEFQKMDYLVSQKLEKYELQIQKREAAYQQQVERLKEIVERKESGEDSPKFRSLKSSQEEENFQCYKASIEGLLEENNKLKKYLLALYHRKEEQEINEEIEKEIKVIQSIMELQQKQY